MPHIVTGWKDWSAQTDWSQPDVVLDLDETAVVVAGFVFGEAPLNLTTTTWAISGGSNAATRCAERAKDSIRLSGVDHVTTYEGAPVTDYARIRGRAAVVTPRQRRSAGPDRAASSSARVASLGSGPSVVLSSFAAAR
ncbi:MAG: hypothetical protein U1F53_07795 [Burkholderiaceae bacterium]